MACDSKQRGKNMFSDLGRATLRGVRKCPKCGTFNGTRGLSCKNKACDVVFKEAGERKKFSIEACRLDTGLPTQNVYSVRVRDKGPDYRSFVSLSANVSDDRDVLLADNDPRIMRTPQCFVESCQRIHMADTFSSILPPVATCQHIQSALRCYATASALPVESAVLNSLNIPTEAKDAIWHLASETNGPLVQRVSKHIMVVKCKQSTKHPLGLLHFAFFCSKLKDKTEQKFYCSCRSFKVKSYGKDEMVNRRCVHFYACICAFACDEKLCEEFSYFINLDKSLQNMALPSPSQQLVAILNDEPSEEGEMSVLMKDSVTFLDAAGLTINEDGQLTQVEGLEQMLPMDQIQVHLQTADGETIMLSGPLNETEADTEVIHVVGMKRPMEDSIPEASLLALQNLPTPSLVKSPSKRLSSQRNVSVASVKKPEPPDESTVSLTFTEWLASITERVNQTMHYQFSGKPEQLVFHVPHVFFDCFRERLSCGSKKKRLPNETKAFFRHNAVPLGSFSKYTWQFTNIIQVKQIFDTPLMPLEITRSFIEHRDGTYELYNHHNEEIEVFRKTGNQPLIKPLELRTFLKVGNTAPYQKEPTPFIIEWVPDLLPLSHIGEMRIKFQFGHQRNGQEVPPPTAKRKLVNSKDGILSCLV